MTDELSETETKLLDEASLRFLRVIRSVHDKDTCVAVARNLKSVLGDAWAGRIVFEILSNENGFRNIVVLTDVPNREQKINVIKEVRAATGMGLGDAKVWVEQVMGSYQDYNEDGSRKVGSPPLKPAMVEFESPEQAEVFVAALQRLGCEVSFG